MTLDELHNFLLESIAPTLEKAWAERDASEKRAAQLQKERDEEHEARKKAEKETASKDKENEALKKALEDERNKNKTNVRNTFGSKSRRSGTAVDGGIDCIIRSLIETCKLWKKSVFEYVRFYFNAIVNGRTDYENLMPWCMSSDR